MALTLYAGYQVRASLLRMPPGNATLHPDFTAHRVALIDAARDGRLVTDVSTSILRMTLINLPTVRVSDLRGRFGEVLEQAREETRGVTLLADPRRQGNREMMDHPGTNGRSDFGWRLGTWGACVAGGWPPGALERRFAAGRGTGLAVDGRRRQTPPRAGRRRAPVSVESGGKTVDGI